MLIHAQTILQRFYNNDSFILITLPILNFSSRCLDVWSLRSLASLYDEHGQLPLDQRTQISLGQLGVPSDFELFLSH